MAQILALTSEPDFAGNPVKRAKTTKYMSDMDQHVYKLYGLTSEEIKTVENLGKEK